MTETSIWHLNEVKVQVGSGYVAATALEAVILDRQGGDPVKLDERRQMRQTKEASISPPFSIAQ